MPYYYARKSDCHSLAVRAMSRILHPLLNPTSTQHRTTFPGSPPMQDGLKTWQGSTSSIAHVYLVLSPWLPDLRKYPESLAKADLELAETRRGSRARGPEQQVMLHHHRVGSEESAVQLGIILCSHSDVDGPACSLRAEVMRRPNLKAPLPSNMAQLSS